MITLRFECIIWILVREERGFPQREQPFQPAKGSAAMVHSPSSLSPLSERRSFSRTLQEACAWSLRTEMFQLKPPEEPLIKGPCFEPKLRSGMRS